MKTLIIHHLESMWDEGYRRFGENFEGLCEKFLEYIQEKNIDGEGFDRIILTRFEENKLEDTHYYTGLGDYIDQVVDYAYGWTKESVEHLEEDDWCEGGYHSKVVMIDQWMRDLLLDADKVFISGAFDGECIDDLETALDHLNINYERIEELII